MRKVVLAMAAIALTAWPGRSRSSLSRGQLPSSRLRKRVKILPQDLRAGATVVTYDPATGARKVLRQGTNFVECQPRMADGFERCYNKAFAPRRDFEAKLRAAEEERRGHPEGASRPPSKTARCRRRPRR